MNTFKQTNLLPAMITYEKQEYKNIILKDIDIFDIPSTESYSLQYFEECNSERVNVFKNNCYLILYFSKGECEYEIDFRKIPVKGGSILFLSPGQIVKVLNQSAISCYRIVFSEEMFNNYNYANQTVQDYDLFIDLCQTVGFELEPEKEDYLCGIFELISKEQESTYKTSNSYIFQHLLTVLLHQFKFSDNLNLVGERAIALEYKKHVFKNISVKHNVEFFCKHLKISKSTLQKATRSTYNKSPKDIIEEIILLEAKRQLLLTDSRIQEIGYNLGFTDPTNFTKFFKRNIGITPENFRKMN
ncbi:AraC family transcriptional regulator [Sphingobacterium bovistauri]|uniref:AraC family transcriptional regulator n=1 Tax=Sphingobacterium bovistauri TaxID=2781959 RepID=A0ABS7Z7T9_9SPHI|nr:AraC family transcriptional regulator [Sphingobacterium bovistauri]MCA5006256.1 AraC family transcriptional regulator [Sphingobacterium bovistauri]